MNIINFRLFLYILFQIKLLVLVIVLCYVIVILF